MRRRTKVIGGAVAALVVLTAIGSATGSHKKAPTKVTAVATTSTIAVATLSPSLAPTSSMPTSMSMPPPSSPVVAKPVAVPLATQLLAAARVSSMIKTVPSREYIVETARSSGVWATGKLTPLPGYELQSSDVVFEKTASGWRMTMIGTGPNVCLAGGMPVATAQTLGCYLLDTATPPPPSPVATTPPVSPVQCTTTSSGSCIQGGEFCRKALYGETGTDADGREYTCTGDTTHPHWE